MELTIQQIANVAGVTVPTLRFYEREKLLLPEGRNGSNYRIYSEPSLIRINFIKAAQTLGFTLSEIKQILVINNKSENYPNALDFAVLKLNQTNNKISKLTNQKDKLAELIEKCSLGGTKDVATFFEYLNKQQLTPSPDFMSCRHSYLFDIGRWVLKGHCHANGELGVKMTGNVYIEHKNNLWSVRRKLHLLDKNNTNESITFNIPIVKDSNVTQKFTAECSVYGEVQGIITFAGQDIFKQYEVSGHGISGCEFLKRIHKDLYESKGVLSNGTKTLIDWDYSMKRDTDINTP